MNHKYNIFTLYIKTIYRKIHPVQVSSYTEWYIEDICGVNLVPPEELKVFFYECFSRIKKIKWDNVWDYLEFWVFNWSSVSSAYLTAKKMKLDNTNFFGFDAFEWLPIWSDDEDDWVWKKWFYACSFDKMKKCLSRKNINSGNIHWIKWWYDETLNKKTLDKYKINNIWIAFIDCDTYSSSKLVLDFIWPLLKWWEILCFDDWKLNNLDIKEMWEYKSFNEFLDNNPHIKAIEIKSYNRKSKSFLIKLI